MSVQHQVIKCKSQTSKSAGLAPLNLLEVSEIGKTLCSGNEVSKVLTHRKTFLWQQLINWNTHIWKIVQRLMNRTKDVLQQKSFYETHFQKSVSLAAINHKNLIHR